MGIVGDIFSGLHAHGFVSMEPLFQLKINTHSNVLIMPHS